MKNSIWANIFDFLDDDFLRIFLPMLDDEEQIRLEEEADDQWGVEEDEDTEDSQG